VWRGWAAGGYLIGYREFTSAEREGIDARIRELEEAGFDG